MSILIGILTTLLVITSLLLIGIVLIQPSKSGGGLGTIGGGVTESVLGASAGNVLTKGTVILASIFMGITLLLVVINAHRGPDSSVSGRAAAAEAAAAKAAASAKAAKDAAPADAATTATAAAAAVTGTAPAAAPAAPVKTP